MLGAALAMLGTAIYIAVAITIEVVAPIGTQPTDRLRGFFLSLVNIGVAVTLANMFALAWSTVGLKPLFGFSIVGWLGVSGAVVASLLFSDFLNYWNHRFQHRFLWRIHRLHHSQTDLHAANAYAHFSERVLRDMLFVLPLSLVTLGFPAVPLAIIFVQQSLELYIHSPTTIHFGPLRRILVDNRFHRIHHSLDARHFDKNFGIAFSIWDRLFGTAYEPAPKEWPLTGVQGVPPPNSIIEYVLFPVH